MRRVVGILVGIFVFAGASAADDVKCPDAITQSQMNACALEEYERADRELNETYAALLRKESADATFVRKLRAAQRAWIRFRDAEIEATFACNEPNPAICWGSVLPTSINMYKAQLTRERTARLQRLMGEGRPAL